MAVDPTVEDFAFSLFRKLWIKNGMLSHPTISEVPDYPDVPEDACPEDFADTVYAFQMLSSSFYSELCANDYNRFGHSRSDFCNYLAKPFEKIFELDVPLDMSGISLAVLAAEMGRACALRGNSMFVFSCPLAFAMVLEENILASIGFETAWNTFSTCGSDFRNIRILSRIIGRSQWLRRTLVYGLYVLGCELGDEFTAYAKCLRAAAKMGGIFDHQGILAKFTTDKYRSAIFFPYILETAHQDPCSRRVNYKLLADDNILCEDRRKMYLREIASLYDLNEKEKNDFVALYEVALLKQKAKIHKVHKICNSNIISDTPSLFELFDLKPKNMESQNDSDLDALSTRHKPEDLCKTPPDALSFEDFEPNDKSRIDTRPSVIQSLRNSLVIPSKLTDDVGDVSPATVDFEDTLGPSCKYPETYRHDSKLVEKWVDMSAMPIEETTPYTINPQQSYYAFQHPFVASWDTACQKIGKLKNIMAGKIESIKHLLLLAQPSISSEPKESGECVDHCEILNIEDQSEDLNPIKSPKDDSSTSAELSERPSSYSAFSVENQRNFHNAAEVSPKAHDSVMTRDSEEEEKLEKNTILSLISGIGAFVNTFKNSKLPQNSSDSEFKDQKDDSAPQLENKDIFMGIAGLDTDVSEDLSDPVVKDQEIFVDTKDSNFRNQEKCKNRSMFSTRDDPVHPNNFEDLLAGLAAFNESSSPSTLTKEEKSLLEDCQSSVFDIFAEKYLKLENEKKVEDSNELLIPSNPDGVDWKSASMEKMALDDTQKSTHFLLQEMMDSLTSVLTGDDYCKSFEDISVGDEGKSEKGSKKRRNRTKQKNEQDPIKETEGPTRIENNSENSQVRKSKSKSDVHQMILIMGVPFNKPTEPDKRFMDRINIKNF